MKLGERFQEKDLTTAKQVKKALKQQYKYGGKLGEILSTISNMRSQDYYHVLAEHYGLEYVDLIKHPPDLSLLKDGEQSLYLNEMCIPINLTHQTLTIATANLSLDKINWIKSHWGQDVRIVATGKFDILTILQKRFDKNYLLESINELLDNNYLLSAKKILTTAHLMTLIFIIGMLGYLIWVDVSAFFKLINIYLTFSVSFILLYKILLSIVALCIDNPYTRARRNSLPQHSLPTYTILVPLYQEKENTLGYLFKNLQQLSYPIHKLDIKILLEQDDVTTIATLKKMHLPRHFEFVYVPQGGPRTKAKACNYGLKFARGEFITLYDAEDKPDPYQLKKALFKFLIAEDEKLACVQCRLNFYNATENWLTKMFTIEYTYWFDLLLPALEYLKTPLPLGGTSNHFKTKILKEINAWDPYNVTEDADLGVRLSRLGFHTKMIASTTYEEANCHLINWIKQRTRWVKGYMQTYIVHMRNPFKLFRSLGPQGFLGFQLFLGGTIVSNLSYVILWIMFVIFLCCNREQAANLFPGSFMYIAYLNFLVGTIGIVLLNLLGIAKRKKYSLILTSLTSPIYWLLMSLASYRALYQLVFKPSYWDKTEHGISKMLN